MALQKLKVIRHPLLTVIANMDGAVRDLAKEANDNGYLVTTTEITYDANAKQCTIELYAEKRGAV